MTVFLIGIWISWLLQLLKKYFVLFFLHFSKIVSASKSGWGLSHKGDVILLVSLEEQSGKEQRTRKRSYGAFRTKDLDNFNRI